MTRAEFERELVKMRAFNDQELANVRRVVEHAPQIVIELIELTGERIAAHKAEAENGSPPVEGLIDVFARLKMIEMILDQGESMIDDMVKSGTLKP